MASLSVGEQGILLLLRYILFVYTVVTWPVYFIIQRPWEVKKAQSKLRANYALKTSDSIVFHGVTESNKQTEAYFMKNNIDTVERIFKNAAQQHGKKKALGTRKVLGEEDEVQENGQIFKKLILGDYQWRTYQEMDTEAEKFGRGLMELGFKTKENIALFSETRAEWMICANGCMKQNMPLVTLFATLGEDALVHGINETGVTCVITSHELLPKFKNILPHTPKVSILLVIEDMLKSLNAQAIEEYNNVKLISYRNVLQIGEESVYPEFPPKKDDIAIIMFTSGSTAAPKGVLLSHWNIVSSLLAYTTFSFKKNDVYMAYLPLAHVFELIVESMFLVWGIPIGYSSPLTLTDKSSKIKRGCKGDASILKPTILASVPLVLDRIYKSIQLNLDNGPSITKLIFDLAIEYKIHWFDHGYNTPIINSFLFKPVKKILGGRVRRIYIGSAPLSPNTHSYLRAVLCCPIMQGYALTETCSIATVMNIDDRSIGTTGDPMPCCAIKLANWEEGNYRVSDFPNPRGEIHVGGPNVVVGYYKQPQKTKEEFYLENERWWFRTGDIGEFTPEGRLKIIDRKKDLVKLQHGEYISLGKIESELKTCAAIDNICLYANPTHSFAVALLVPNPDRLTEIAKKHGINWESWEDLCANSVMENLVFKEIQIHSTMCRLNKFETPQKIKLISDIWTPDTGLVTAALKLRRRNIQNHYQQLIDIMYS